MGLTNSQKVELNKLIALMETYDSDDKTICQKLATEDISKSVVIIKNLFPEYASLGTDIQAIASACSAATQSGDYTDVTTQLDALLAYLKKIAG